MSDEGSLIVCLGGSAGALDAYIRFLRELPSNAGLAIIVIHHLRKWSTTLPEILARVTSMPVELIANGMFIERNHVYVIPSNHDLALRDGSFQVSDQSKPSGWPNVITLFLNCLASRWTGKGVAVILSGVGSDGADALRVIKTAGGITFAQKLETAVHPEMPRNALKTGFVDFELSPEDIAHELLRIRL